jgi:hypothetical protein
MMMTTMVVLTIVTTTNEFTRLHGNSRRNQSQYVLSAFTAVLPVAHALQYFVRQVFLILPIRLRYSILPQTLSEALLFLVGLWLYLFLTPRCRISYGAAVGFGIIPGVWTVRTGLVLDGLQIHNLHHTDHRCTIQRLCVS